MSIPNWKKWLSYLWPIRLYSGDDLHHNHLELHLYQNRLRLQTNKVIYSYDDLYHIFMDGFYLIDFERFKGRRALVLGLGMGSIPYILEKEMDRNFAYTGVEIDTVINRLFKTYSRPRFKSPIELREVDVLAFWADNSSNYDLIAVDIFVDGQVPDFAKSISFLNQVKAILARDGLVMFNYMKLKDTQDRDQFFDHFLHVFPEGTLKELPHNWMGISCKRYIK